MQVFMSVQKLSPLMYAKTQLTSETTGWPGPGKPSLRSYSTEVRRIFQLIWHREYQTGLNRTQSLLANIWNFQVRAGEESAVCPCCGWHGPAFLSLSNWRAVQPNSRCPSCDSRSRHRGLWLLLPDVLRDKPEGLSLVFAPERALMTQLNRLITDPIVTTDYLRTDVHFPGEDIQHLSFTDNSFAFLMCNHVLEHIPDDARALAECARVLKPGGLAIFTIPGDFQKRETWYFDQPDSNGHMRHYGLDVLDKMRAAGFSHITPIDMSLGQPAHYHIHAGDFAFICVK